MDDGAFAFGSRRRDIELLLLDPLRSLRQVGYRVIPQTAGTKTVQVAMYIGQPVVNLREPEFLPDEAIPRSRWGTERRQ